MINRRSLVAGTAAGITAVSAGTLTLFAQSEDAEVAFTNATFIRDLNADSGATPEASESGATPEAGGSELDLEDLRGYILGDPDAPNTLQLYADYRCPHCRAFHQEIEPGLIEDFVATGRMNIELLDFTVIGVKTFEDLTDDTIESVQAAEAAACAAEQDGFLEFREWLFSGPQRTNDGDFSDDNLIAQAEELGLDVDLFSASLLDGVYEKAVIAMVELGLDRGVEGTPFMILNDDEKLFVPAGGYDALKEEIEALLQ